ncbi:MAG: putative tRNA threonylcarbamoyladenosine biosynthesis protein Gcp [candidate division TM6 bacterium GW2011_GWF2_36_6]|nr:MAG: putative tRNA threonylcarbamoyladenosine biosynthesis protein Gcp [candidate division TM6 bacterium GW2011_GWF2_36_6]
MSLVLGIETSCDETGAAVYDSSSGRILSTVIFSQISMHAAFGGVVPEIASRSQLEKISPIVQEALSQASVKIDDIDVIAVAKGPGLVGSLFVGLCFAKGIAWSRNKKIIGVNHLEGHLFSSFLKSDSAVETNITFPHLCLSVSGGHTTLYLVKDFGDYQVVGQTIDDAAGEAFDKIAKVLGFAYPGGPIIEKLAQQVNYQDFFKYPRTKNIGGDVFFSFSGLKTAVLYDLVKRGAYNLNTGAIQENLTLELKQQVASSLLACISDVFVNNVKFAFKKYPDIKCLTFVGGVACNKFLRQNLNQFCLQKNKILFVAPPQFCTDNAAMIAFVGGYKHLNGYADDFSLDVGL